jgi:hypothetical protein
MLANPMGKSCICRHRGAERRTFVTSVMPSASAGPPPAARRAERGDGRPSMHEHSLAAIKAAVERCGVVFLGDYGLRLVSAQDIGGDDIVDLSAKKTVMEIGSEWGPGGHPLSVHRSTG